MGITLKSKLRSKKITVGSWVTIGSTAVAEIMAKAGFEWLTVDMEHSAITLDRAQELMQVIGLSGITPLVRVSENNAGIIKRVMDAGASGVIVPMVNTGRDARNAVAAVKYPPEGRRGVGLARAQGYGLEFEKYKKWVKKESVVIVQIEHIEAVENLVSILSVEGVDAFMVGPYDLSASLGMPGELGHPKVKRALQAIMNTAKNYGVSPGIHVVYPDTDEVFKRIREGYRLIAYSFDAMLLGAKSGDGLRSIRNGMKR